MRTKANKNIYYPGDHKVRCDKCGLVYLRSECKMTWDNRLSCVECYDEKQPQLNIRGRGGRQSVRDARPMPEDSDNLFFYTPEPDDL